MIRCGRSRRSSSVCWRCSTDGGRPRWLGLVGKDTHLDELRLVGRRVVPLRVLGARGERHPLRAARLQHAFVAQTVGVFEVAGHHVGDAFDVAVGIHWPDGGGHDRVVVGHSHRADAHVCGLAVLVEAEVLARNQPPSLA
jgi:hypothetical protein